MLSTQRFFALIISILAINNILIMTPFTPLPIYYGMFLLTFILAILNSRIKLDIATVIFVIVCSASVTFNNIPAYFRPIERLAIFVISLLVISPLLQSDFMKKVRLHCFKFSNRIIVTVVFISFIGKITGIYPGLDFANHFGGLTLSSMSIAPLAAVSFIIAVFQLKNGSLSKMYKWFFRFMILASFLVLLLSASRIAIGSLLVASLYLLTKIYNEKYSKFVRVIFVFSMLTVASFPLLDSYTNDLVLKTEQRNVDGNFLSSREQLWAFRLQEFNQSPLIGIGFSNAMYGSINYDTGTVEPGTSWGVILSMIGVLGLSVFVFLLISAFRRNSKINSKNYLSISDFLNTLLIFFMFHWIAEGYILAANSYLFFYSWLILGVSGINQQNKKIEII